MGKEDMIKRGIGIQENLPARAGDVFEFRHEPFQNAVWKSEQKPIAGRVFVHTLKPPRFALVPVWQEAAEVEALT